MADADELLVLPCPVADLGSQRCWLGPQFMNLSDLKLYDLVTVHISPHRSYICRVWPRIDGCGDNYIQFDGTVGTSADGSMLRSSSVSKLFTINRIAVQKTTCSTLKSISVTVVINCRQELLSYKQECSSLLASRVRHLLKGLSVAPGYVALCSSLALGKVYDWDRVIVDEACPRQQTFCGVVTDNTEIIVKDFCCMEKYERKFFKPVRLGGLDYEIQLLKDIVMRSSTAVVCCSDNIRHMDYIPGVLLTGPPGCGKRTLIRRVAAECDAVIVHIDSSLHGARPGDSERNLQAAFRRAADLSTDELCILYLDELDAICPRRRDTGTEGDSLATRMLAELLNLMDKLHENPSRFVVVATTSKPTDVDPCLRRFGRFEKEIFVGIPGESQRKDILQVSMPVKAIAEDVDVTSLASATAGYTGADLTSLVNVAVVNALDHTSVVDGEPLKLRVTMADFTSALHLVRPSIQGASDMFITNKKPICWDDIGGLAEVKQQLIQSVEWPRKYPSICRRFGLRPPRGILLYGPPGCAKTSLARAAAASCNVNFLAVSSAQLYSPYFGDAEKQIDELFRQARACAPSLLFIDEIDSVIGSRTADDCGSSGGSVQQRVLSALLTQMDGIGMNSSDVQRHRTTAADDQIDDTTVHEPDDTNVLVIAATNRLDMVDSALLRPGRMDRIIYIPPPDFDARMEIIKVYTRNKPIENVDLEELTRKTSGFTGADLENLCNEASLFAIHSDGPQSQLVTNEHFYAVLSRLKPSVSAMDLAEYERMNNLRSQVV